MKVILTPETVKFIQGLDLIANTKVKRRIAVLREFGYMIRMPASKNILPGIFELRTVGKDNIRLVFMFRNDAAVVFHAFVKKTEQISAKEMNLIRQKFNLLHL